MKEEVLPLSEKDFALFQSFLIEESGLYFDKDRAQLLHLALWRRLQELQYNSYQEYYTLLQRQPEGRFELVRLLNLITIGETYFFRNRPQFDALIDTILPEIIQNKMYSSQRCIRIWSAGCSKGDEPYSVAIAIIEVLPLFENWNISILGTDINSEALAYAREASYTQRDVAQLPRVYLNKYFQRKGIRYVLNNKVRGLVRFEYHNLARDSFNLQGMHDLDIIFCRNVTIYFDLPTTKRIIDNFYDCLAPGGYLFLGHAETLWQITTKFEIKELPQTIVYKKASSPVDNTSIRPFVGVPEFEFSALSFNEGPLKRDAISKCEWSGRGQSDNDVDRGRIGRKEWILLYKEATRLLKEKDYEGAILCFDRIIRQNKNHTQAYFGKATILANQARYKDAIDILKRIIEMDSLYIEAYYLLGVLSYKISNFKEAEIQFRKVIYIDPEIILAYFNLGNIYLCQRMFNRAAREFNNAIRLLEAKPREDRVRFCEDFTVDFLLRACRNNLAIIRS